MRGVPSHSNQMRRTPPLHLRGAELCQATVVIRERTLEVRPGHVGSAGLRIMADSARWLGFLAKERNLVWGLLRRKLRLQGSPRLLRAFARCFPA